MKTIRPTVLTSYFLLLPLVVALYFNIYLYAILITLSLIFSLKYHSGDEREWKKADSALATILFLYNLYACFLFRYEWEFIIPVALIVIAAFFLFFIQKRNYDFYHSIWHLLVISGTLMCVLGLGFL